MSQLRRKSMLAIIFQQVAPTLTNRVNSAIGTIGQCRSGVQYVHGFLDTLPTLQRLSVAGSINSV